MKELQFENFSLEVREGIAVFTINRQEVRNALSPECFLELIRFLDYTEDCDDIKVIILTGAGDKAFASGADIRGLQTRKAVDNLNQPSKNAMLKIENSSKPVIAAVNGVAFGGGCELAMACDIRILADHAKIGLPETNLGIMPGAGGTQRLARMVGVSRAKEMIMGGKVLKAEEAVQCGFAMEHVPLDQLMDAAMRLAHVMLNKGPLALMLAKKAINASLYTDVNTGILLENLAFSVLLETEDKMEGTTAFLEKRPAKFQGK